MDRQSLTARLKEFLANTQEHGEVGASSVIAAAGTDMARVLRSVQILTDGSTFFETLLQYLGQKDLHPVSFYTAANISAQTWNQMQARTHNTSKTTVFRAVLTLELDYLDAAILMEKAGYTFRSNQQMDMAMTFFLREGIYEQSIVDELLYEIGEPTLFS